MKFISNLETFHHAKTGILTNHTGYDLIDGYHFISLAKQLNLVRVFIPEHGLFAELQDQVSGSDLKYFEQDLDFCNLYGDTEKSLVPPDEKLLDLELFIIDIRDVGSRYYTFLTTAYYILEKLSLLKKTKTIPHIIIFDSPNPIGRKVEGSPLLKDYTSFVGVESVLHRHGLSPAGLMCYYNEEMKLSLDLNIIKPGKYHPQEYSHLTWIPPSPNIPSLTSCLVYPGQCLLEGTNLSEGRGTTRPFEIFGAPFLKLDDTRILKEIEAINNRSFHLRPLRFVPTFHKHKDLICNGYHLMVLDANQFHSLLFTLSFLRAVLQFYPTEFQFLDGVYEFRSDRPAIELLVGDPKLLDYIQGKESYQNTKDFLLFEEGKWLTKISQFLYE